MDKFPVSARKGAHECAFLRPTRPNLLVGGWHCFGTLRCFSHRFSPLLKIHLIRNSLSSSCGHSLISPSMATGSDSASFTERIANSTLRQTAVDPFFARPQACQTLWDLETIDSTTVDQCPCPRCMQRNFSQLRSPKRLATRRSRLNRGNINLRNL